MDWSNTRVVVEEILELEEAAKYAMEEEREKP